jgi:ribosomal RNA-processing protein 9
VCVQLSFSQSDLPRHRSHSETNHLFSISINLLETMSRRKKTTKALPVSGSKRSRTLDLGYDDEHIDSASEGDEDGEHVVSLEDGHESQDEEPLETKRVRLAREFLAKVDAKSDDSSDEEVDDEEDDRLGRKLQRARQKQEGSLQRILADKTAKHAKSLHSPEESKNNIHYLRGHDLTPTCVALSGSSRAVSGSKDHSVIMWDLEKETRITNIIEHWKKTTDQRTAGQVLSVACSDDERYAAVGKRDATVSIFDIRAKAGCNLVHKFEGHKGAVTCLSFRSQSLQLFSGSDDRCIRHYNLEEMLYLETLYGHQFGVNSIDCHRKELPISVGQDRTARAWKLEEDSHLIFRGGSKIQAADSVTVIKDDWFLSGHQDGHLSLWMTGKKRAAATIESAHGFEECGTPRNVSTVSCLAGSDFAASGSNDGFLRFWKVSTGKTVPERTIEPICEIPMQGYINAIAVGPKARFCVAAIGQEHRLGRWNRVAGAKNRIAVVKLYDEQLVLEDEDDELVEADQGNAEEQQGEPVESSDSSESDGAMSD